MLQSARTDTSNSSERLRPVDKWLQLILLGEDFEHIVNKRYVIVLPPHVVLPPARELGLFGRDKTLQSLTLSLPAPKVCFKVDD